MPGMNPLGRVGVHVLPPSKVALTPQPSLYFQSLLPVIKLLGVAGLTASGVSFCAVVSRLTLTTRAGALLRAVLKLGPSGVSDVMGASWQAAQSSAATARVVRRAGRICSSRRESRAVE